MTTQSEEVMHIFDKFFTDSKQDGTTVEDMDVDFDEDDILKVINSFAPGSDGLPNRI